MDRYIQLYMSEHEYGAASSMFHVKLHRYDSLIIDATGNEKKNIFVNKTSEKSLYNVKMGKMANIVISFFRIVPYLNVLGFTLQYNRFK